MWHNNYEDDDDDNIFEDNVLTSREILVYVLSSVSLEALPLCARVCRDWYLVVKYLVPTPLSQLRMVACGELLYNLRLSEVPRTVILRVSFAMGEPKWVEIIQSKTTNRRNVQSKLDKLLSEYNNNNNNNSYKNGFVKHDNDNSNSNKNGKNGININRNINENDIIKHQIIHLSDIRFVIDGHWTPTFEHLEKSDEFNLDESQFFSRNKSFSIVTNSYMAYDFIAFNSETCKNIVSILRNLLRQSSSNAKIMAIYAKANKKYQFSMQQQNKQLLFTNNSQALSFDLFVLTLRDSFHEISNEISFPIPQSCIETITASQLYPSIIAENIPTTKWIEYCRARILKYLQKRGLIDVLHSPDGDIPYDGIESEDDENDGPSNKPNITLNTLNIDNKNGSKFVPFTPHNQPVSHFKTYLQTMQYERENGIPNGQNGFRNGRQRGHARRSSRIVADNVEKGNINAHEGFEQIKHHKKTSSLFNLQSFPMDESYDLFKGGVDQDGISQLTNAIAINSDNPTQDGQQCSIM